MSNATVPTIGQTIARLRRNRMTQTDLAAAAQVSVDLIRKLEQGQRHTVSIGSLQRLARALDVDAGELLGRPSPLTAAPQQAAGAVAIRDALTAVDDLTTGEVQVEPMTLDAARKAVRYAWAGYWSANHQALSGLLPSTVAQMRATVRSAPDAERPEVCDLYAQLLEVTATTMVHLGYPDLGHLALREALRIAEQGDNPRRPAATRGALAWTLLTQGRYEEGRRLAIATAEAVEPTTDDDVSGWTLYGTLLLTAATSVARAGDRDTAVTLLDDAAGIAERTGPRSDWETAWSPDGVLMQRVDVDVVTEQYAAAVATAEQMPTNGALSRRSRCRHLFDVALAQLRLDRDDAALDTMLHVEELSPSWLRVQPESRQIVQDLHHRASHPPRLTALVERMGLATV